MPAVLNLARMDRVNRYLRIKMQEGKSYRLAQPSYSYLEMPLGQFLDAKGEEVQEVKANQVVTVVPAGTISLTGPHTALVQVNSKLVAVANVPAMFLLASDEPSDITFLAQFRKSFDISELNWAVRIFLLD